MLKGEAEPTPAEMLTGARQYERTLAVIIAALGERR
jgi:hypothetical protein